LLRPSGQQTADVPEICGLRVRASSPLSAPPTGLQTPNSRFFAAVLSLERVGGEPNPTASDQLVFQDFSRCRGGARTPDTRIMIASIGAQKPQFAANSCGLETVLDGQNRRRWDEVRDEVAPDGLIARAPQKRRRPGASKGAGALAAMRPVLAALRRERKVRITLTGRRYATPSKDHPPSLRGTPASPAARGCFHAGAVA
jgi:hypothetical protein